MTEQVVIKPEKCRYCGKPLPHTVITTTDGKYVTCLTKEDMKE